jgi:hypothetical protein
VGRPAQGIFVPFYAELYDGVSAALAAVVGHAEALGQPQAPKGGRKRKVHYQAAAEIPASLQASMAVADAAVRRRAPRPAAPPRPAPPPRAIAAQLVPPPPPSGLALVHAA